MLYILDVQWEMLLSVHVLLAGNKLEDRSEHAAARSPRLAPERAFVQTDDQDPRHYHMPIRC
jgi:hypothetical protein